MQINSFDDLVEILQKENVPFRADRDNQVVELAVHTGPLHTEMVIRWEAQLVLAQFIVAFPLHVPVERLGPVEHALAVLNHRLIMPGFGVDNEKRLLYFRLVTPRQDDGSMSYDQINRLVSAAVDTLLDFYPLLVGVVNEGKSVDELLSALAPGLAKLPDRPDPAAAVASLEASGGAPEVAGATTQEPAAPEKAAGVTAAAPGIQPQTPGVHPEAAEQPAPTPGEVLQAQATPSEPAAAPAPAGDPAHPERSVS